MLYVASNILRVHYTNAVFHFHKVAQVRYVGEVDTFKVYYVKKYLPTYNGTKILKIDRDLPEL